MIGLGGLAAAFHQKPVPTKGDPVVSDAVMVDAREKPEKVKVDKTAKGDKPRIQYCKWNILEDEMCECCESFLMLEH